ncbi:MAG: DNA polymerase III subunit beta [Spirochaetota bacterium]
MKFSCEKNPILKEIATAQDIISSRNVLSILSNVLLDVKESNLIIKATDLKVGFETKIPVLVTEAGSTTVYCDKFLNILRVLPDGEIDFEQTDNRLIIKPKNRRIDFQLKTIESDKFPEIKETMSGNYFQMPQKDLMDMISQTIFAVSDDETRYFMNGVFFEKHGQKVIMVATDGRRMSFVSKELDAQMEDFKGVIIPPKILNLIRKLSFGEGSISMAVTDKSIFFQFNNQKLSSNLIEGQFPNYKRVIPEKQEYQITVNRELLLEALKRVSLLVEQKSRRVYVSAGNDTLTLKAEESEIGQAQEEIACSYQGPDTNIAMNYLYLLEPVRVMEEGEICIKFSEPNKAITILSEPEKEYFHIVMPMQLD